MDESDYRRFYDEAVDTLVDAGEVPADTPKWDQLSDAQRRVIDGFVSTAWWAIGAEYSANP